MKLWIRTQDRSNFKKVNNIYVEKIMKDYDSWVGNIHSMPYVITSDNGNLGFYATEERTLEVLDEIQNILEPNIEYVPIVEEDVKPEYTYKHYKSVGYEVRGCKFEQFDTYVYEMPKE